MRRARRQPLPESPKPLLIDTNLLVLLIVGRFSPDLISRHKRTRKYSIEDFELLLRIATNAPSLVTTPNVLTEASNLLDDDERLQRILALLVNQAQETFVESRTACAQPEFPRLGLADAAILEASAGHGVLTDDLGLYLALQDRGIESWNFNHFREALWQQLPTSRPPSGRRSKGAARRTSGGRR